VTSLAPTSKVLARNFSDYPTYQELPGQEATNHSFAFEDSTKKCQNPAMRAPILLVCCLLWFGQDIQKPRPQFSDYAVKEIYRGKPALPIIPKDWRMYRTMIKNGAETDVEFAGHYTIPRWGCGTDCNVFVIVDSISGRVYDGFELSELPAAWTEKHEGNNTARMEFYSNSRLLKLNACPSEKNCGLYDYLMVEGKGLTLVRKQLLQ
jgi:hypothetical protein